MFDPRSNLKGKISKKPWNPNFVAIKWIWSKRVWSRNNNRILLINSAVNQCSPVNVIYKTANEANPNKNSKEKNNPHLSPQNK